MRIFDNLERIKKRIGEGVILVVVTKNRSVLEIREVLDFGVLDLGENYVSEALGKFCELKGDVKKHFIGVIQSNKVRDIVENFDLIQSVDRLKVARLIDRFAGEAGKVMPVLVQVNISFDNGKSGVLPGEVEGFLSEISCLENVRVVGLMCIGSSGCREEFRDMKRLFDDLALIGHDSGEPKEKGFCMEILSMGMSGDFEMAIEEGSNMVRIGGGVFE